MITFLDESAREGPEIDTPEKQILYLDATACKTLDDVILKLISRLEIPDKVTEGYTSFYYNDHNLDLANWFYANANRDIWWFVDVRKSVLATAGYKEVHRCFDIFRHSLLLAVSWGEFHDMDYRAMKLFIGGPGWKMFVGAVEG